MLKTVQPALDTVHAVLPSNITASAQSLFPTLADPQSSPAPPQSPVTCSIETFVQNVFFFSFFSLLNQSDLERK